MIPSHHAGMFLCDSTLYELLTLQEEGKLDSGNFFHMLENPSETDKRKFAGALLDTLYPFWHTPIDANP